jgi:hypothetical protein
MRWNKAGVLTTAGKPWQTSTVRQLLLRPLNAGLVQHQDRILTDENGDYVRTEAAPLVPVDTYLALVALLKNPDRATTTTNEVRWLSSGIAKCAADNYPLRTASRGGAEDRVRVYRCTKPGCGTSVRAHYLDAAVRGAALDAYMHLPTEGTTEQQAQTQAVTELLRRLDDNAKAQAEMRQLVKLRVQTASQVAPELTELRREEAELNEAITAERSRSVHAKMMTEARLAMFVGHKANLNDAANIKRELGERFDSLTVTEQRIITRAVLRSVRLLPGKPGGAHKHMADRVRDRIDVKDIADPE